jgi:type I restriction enzyme M protein
VIRAIVDVMRPTPLIRICDPACGTGGFLVAAFEYLKDRVASAKEAAHLRERTLHGIDLVPNVARLCAMNLFLHGIGTDHNHPVVSISDSLEARTTESVDMVLTNPPFGKKSSFTIVGTGGKNQTEKISYERPDFWATTSNKQLNFVQHVCSMLNETGRAAVVVPDNVLFEGGAGEKIRRALLQQCEVHTLLRLPTGIWYSPGVKANVLFFDKKRLAMAPATKELWVYDLRSGRSHSLRQNPISSGDLTDFVKSYNADDRKQRQETPHFRRFTYADIVARDKASLDIQWQKEAANGTQGESPRALMKEILKDLEEAMREFAAAEAEIER